MRGNVAVRWCFLVGPLVAGCVFLTSCNRGPVDPPKVEAKGEAPVGPPFFQDVTEASGVRHTYRNGEEAGHYAILETLGGGVALLDYDGDGLLDIFVTGGGGFEGPDKKTIIGLTSHLYRNLGGMKFQDVTKEAGLDGPQFYTQGCAVADYDRDGWPDLLVTGWGRVALYHNEPVDPKDPAKGRRFVEVTRQAGLNDDKWSTSAAWADLDGDGFPDLYLCHYVDWSFENHRRCGGYSVGVDRDVCPPKEFQGLPHLLYRNNGNGTFSDISKDAGLNLRGTLDANGKQAEVGKGLGVVVADFNGDRKPDIYVANDTVANLMYWNRGKMKFEESGVPSGVALDDSGGANGSMGVDCGDYDRSGLPSLFVTNYEGEMHALYRNLGKRELFTFSTTVAGIAAIGQRYVGFGTAFVDVDSDGWLDLVAVNGHVIRHPAGAAGIKQAPVLLRNQGQGRFKAITPQGGNYFKSDHRGRGLAVGDLDNDGRPDLVVNHVNEPVAVLRNIHGDAGKKPHWLGLSLQGKKHADLVGTRVILECHGEKQTRFIKGGGSFLSSSDPRLIFGLGDHERIDRITIEWASGADQIIEGKDLAIDRYWSVREGEAAK
jgi:hypothetical protein